MKDKLSPLEQLALPIGKMVLTFIAIYILGGIISAVSEALGHFEDEEFQ